MARPATPPMTPPTIAPVLVLLEEEGAIEGEILAVAEGNVLEVNICVDVAISLVGLRLLSVTVDVGIEESIVLLELSIVVVVVAVVVILSTVVVVVTSAGAVVVVVPWSAVVLSPLSSVVVESIH